MKKVLFFFLVLCCFTSVYAAQAIHFPPLKACDLYLSLKNGRQVSLSEISRMSLKEWQAVTGKKLTLLNKAGLLMTQRVLRKGVRPDGSFRTRRLELVAEKAQDRWRFHLGGFALGFLLGWIGLIIAAGIEDEKRARRLTWALVGFGISAIAIVVFLLANPIFTI